MCNIRLGNRTIKVLYIIIPRVAVAPVVVFIQKEWEKRDTSVVLTLVQLGLCSSARNCVGRTVLNPIDIR